MKIHFLKVVLFFYCNYRLIHFSFFSGCYFSEWERASAFVCFYRAFWKNGCLASPYSSVFAFVFLFRGNTTRSWGRKCGIQKVLHVLMAFKFIFWIIWYNSWWSKCCKSYLGWCLSFKFCYSYIKGQIQTVYFLVRLGN